VDNYLENGEPNVEFFFFQVHDSSVIVQNCELTAQSTLPLQNPKRIKQSDFYKTICKLLILSASLSIR